MSERFDDDDEDYPAKKDAFSQTKNEQTTFQERLAGNIEYRAEFYPIEAIVNKTW